MKYIEEFNKTLKLVIECGKILENADYEKKTKEKNDGSIVTKYDMIIDKKLTEGLKEILNCPILSEEHEEKLGNIYFVVDPIDGTSNFDRGIEHFGIMVALVEDEQTLFSIVEMPLLNRTYTAIKDEGAYINKKRIFTRRPDHRLVGNLNLNNMISTKIIENLVKQNEYKIELRCLYGACAPLCFVADGTFDFTIQTGGMSIWDIIAPKLIIEEAGGICQVDKMDNQKYSIIACGNETRNILNKLLDI